MPKNKTGQEDGDAVDNGGIGKLAAPLNNGADLADTFDSDGEERERTNDDANDVADAVNATDEGEPSGKLSKSPPTNNNNNSAATNPRPNKLSPPLVDHSYTNYAILTDDQLRLLDEDPSALGESAMKNEEEKTARKKLMAMSCTYGPKKKNAGGVVQPFPSKVGFPARAAVSLLYLQWDLLTVTPPFSPISTANGRPRPPRSLRHHHLDAPRSLLPRQTTKAIRLRHSPPFLQTNQIPILHSTTQPMGIQTHLQGYRRRCVLS